MTERFLAVIPYKVNSDVSDNEKEERKKKKTL